MTPFCETDIQAWYATAIKKTHGNPNIDGIAHFPIPDLSHKTNDKDWYYKPTFPEPTKYKSCNHAPMLGLKTKGNGLSLNKPLPVSKRGVRTQNIELSLNKPLPILPCFRTVRVEPTSTAASTFMGNEPVAQAPVLRWHDVSVTRNPAIVLETSTNAQFAFAQAGVQLDAKDIVDNHFAALGTGLEDTLNIDEAEELEKCRATEHFYGTKANEAPAQYYAPVVDETSGFADFRVGMDDFPDMWKPVTEKLADYESKGAERMEIQWTKAQDSKTILKPKTRKTPAVKQDVAVTDAPLSFGVIQNIVNAPVVRAPSPGTVIKVSKRTVRDSFDRTSTCYAIEDDDGIVNVLPTKKIRVTEYEASEDIQDVQSLRAISVHSNGSFDSYVSLEDNLSESSYVAGSPRAKRKDSTLTGYQGQFSSFEVPYLHRKKACRSPRTFEFGNPLHTNGVYTHTNFIPDPDAHTLNYTQAMLDRLPTRKISWQHATSMSNRAQKVMTRSPSEENLRREIQLECTAARLEGVSVGEYRYFQGHMTGEEYKAANMCICWHQCYCSKLCTRFGDVLCPCSEDMELPEN